MSQQAWTSDHDVDICAGHAELGRALRQVLEGVRRGDARGLRPRWEAFAEALLDHLDYEEAAIFIEYEQESHAHATVVRELTGDHAVARQLISRAGETFGAPSSPLSTIEPIVDELLSVLRAHSERESSTVYAWLRERNGSRIR